MMQRQVYVLESRTFVRLPEGTDLEAMAAEHGGDLVGHFPDSEIVDAKVDAIRLATQQELKEIDERDASFDWQPPPADSG